MKTWPEFSRRLLFQERPMQKAARLCAFALVVMCTGCGETNRQLFHRYQNQFAEKRQQFKQIAQMLPAPGSLKGATAANLSPPPVYNAKSNSYNTEIVMYDQLFDPDIESQGHNRLDLLLSGDLLRCVLWTGPKDPMNESALDERAGDMEQMLKKVLGFRYLVVLRPVNIVAPAAVNESTYKPGMADIEGVLVEMEGNKVAAAFRFTAHSASQVEYSYKEDQSRESQLEEFAYSSLCTDARQKLGPLLEQTTGGQFVLEK